MRFVGKCGKCGEQKIIDEWMRCKSCFDKWLADALNRPVILEQPKGESFTLQPNNDPAPPDPSPLRSKRAGTVITDDFQGPQLDPAKVDEAVAACGAAKDAAKMAEDFNLGREMSKFYPAPDVTKQEADRQREPNQAVRKLIDRKFNKPKHLPKPYILGFKNSRKF